MNRETTATLLDIIFTNDLDNDFTAGILLNDIADHCPVFYMKHGNVKKDEKTSTGTFKKRIINKHTAGNLNKALKRTDWSFLEKIQSTDEKYETFRAKIKELFEKYIPTKIVTQTKNIVKQPWITSAIAKSCATKNRLYTESIGSPSYEKSIHYRKYRNLLEIVKRKSKKWYYEKLFEKIKSDLKSTWQEINKILNK